MVNSGMFAELETVSYGAIYIATGISAVIGTVLIGLLSNLPLAQASGMGLNAFFVYTVCFGLGFTYANALLFVLADGLLFILLTVTGLRKLIFDAIPAPVKAAIPAGIEMKMPQLSQLWGAVLALKQLYPNATTWNGAILSAISALIEEYQDDIILSHIGFPADWATQLRKENE